MSANVTVEILAVATGERRTFTDAQAWKVQRAEGDAGWIAHWWTEGNGACDCNRGATFRGVTSDTITRTYPNDDYPCGDTRYRIRLTIDGHIVEDEIGDDE